MTRADRRRRLKEDQRLVARGLEEDRRDHVQIMALMRLLHDRLEEARDAGTVAPLMTFLHDNFRAAEQAAPKKSLACRRGCPHCCHAWVSARAPEVLFVKAAIPVREQAAVRAAVGAVFTLTGPLTFEERVKRPTPCPLLRDDLCLVYAARPATCRTAVSRDVAACERAFRLGSENEDIPTPTFYIEMRAGYSLALAGALRRAGFPAAAYEYNAALNAVLGTPGAEAAWLAGEDVFAGVAGDPSGDPFDRPGNRRIYDAAWAA
jgi:hypothetical protein